MCIYIYIKTYTSHEDLLGCQSPYTEPGDKAGVGSVSASTLRLEELQVGAQHLEGTKSEPWSMAPIALMDVSLTHWWESKGTSNVIRRYKTIKQTGIC